MRFVRPYIITSSFLRSKRMLKISVVLGYSKYRWIKSFHSFYHFIRGNFYYAKGDYDRAIGDYNKAIELNPKDADAYNNRGLAYKKLGKISEAQRDFEESRKLNYF